MESLGLLHLYYGDGKGKTTAATLRQSKSAAWVRK